MTDSVTNQSSVVTAVWPDAVPHPQVDRILLVVVGKKAMQWSSLEKIESDFVPGMYWHTGTVPEDADNEIVVADFFPIQLHPLLLHSKGLVGHPRFMKRVPVVPCYIVSSHDDKVAGLVRLLTHVPIQLYRLTTDDFLGPHPGIDMERIVAAWAAVQAHGVPALVVNGGKTLTYTAVNGKGEIEGGGIGCGLGLKLAELADQANVTHRSPSDWMASRGENATPLSLMATDESDALWSATLHETTVHLTGIFNWWQSHAKNQVEDARAAGLSVNESFTIAMTGEDGPMLAELLQPGHAGMIEPVPGLPLEERQWQLVLDKELVLKGMSCVVAEQAQRTTELISEEDTLRRLMVGQRVLDRSGQELVLGTVAGIVRNAEFGQDQYSILYDDGDRGIVGLGELYWGLKMYGEEKHEGAAAKLESKMQASAEAADALAAYCPLVKEELKESKPTTSPTFPFYSPTTLGTSTASSSITTRSRSETAETDGSASRAAAPLNRAKRLKLSRPAIPSMPTLELTTTGCREAAEQLIGQRVAKYFSGVLYWGTVQTYFGAMETEKRQALWNIAYDDGENEDYEARQLAGFLTRAVEMKDEDPKKKTSKK